MPKFQSEPNNKRPHQRGFTLVEMGLVITVVAALLVGVMVLIPKIKLDRAMAAAREEIPVVVSQLRAGFLNQTSTTGLTTNLAKGFGAFRSRPAGPAVNLVWGPTSTINLWQEAVFDNKDLVMPVVTRQGGAIVYWLINVPVDLCVPMMQLLAAQPGVVQVYGSGGGYLTGYPAAGGSLPSVMRAAGDVKPSGLVLNVTKMGQACTTTSNGIAAMIAI